MCISLLSRKPKPLRKQSTAGIGTVSEQHEFSEKFLKERQTEFDNRLEADSMPLEEKISTLESGPEVQIKKYVALLKTEKERIVAETVEDLKLQALSFQPPREVRRSNRSTGGALEKRLLTSNQNPLPISRPTTPA